MHAGIDIMSASQDFGHMSIHSARDSRIYRFVTVAILGFYSGLPLALVGSSLKLWMSSSGFDIKTISLFGLVSLPFTFKFLAGPVVDSYFLDFLGRRRTWLLLSQLGLGMMMYVLSTQHPSPEREVSLFFMYAFGIAFFSALQDTVIDAYKREILPDADLGMGSTLGVYGYRVAMLVSGGLATSMVDPATLNLTWSQIYLFFAGAMLVGVVYTYFLVVEPMSFKPKASSFFMDFVNPLKSFFSRPGAGIILLFIFTYKLGDSFAGSLLSVFYSQVGYSNLEIGSVAKAMGTFTTLFGLFIGGLILMRWSIYRVLLLAGVLQSLSTIAFFTLNLGFKSIPLFAFAVGLEDFTGGIGTSAFVAYIAQLTDKNYTATQFAALSSIATLGRSFVSVYAGHVEEAIGWSGLFIASGLFGFVGVVLLLQFKKVLYPELKVSENH